MGNQWITWFIFHSPFHMKLYSLFTFKLTALWKCLLSYCFTFVTFSASLVFTSLIYLLIYLTVPYSSTRLINQSLLILTVITTSCYSLISSRTSSHRVILLFDSLSRSLSLPLSDSSYKLLLITDTRVLWARSSIPSSLVFPLFTCNFTAFEVKNYLNMARAIKGKKPEIVISGISGRFPSSNSITEFKDNLFNRVDMVTADDTRFPAG